MFEMLRATSSKDFDAQIVLGVVESPVHRRNLILAFESTGAKKSLSFTTACPHGKPLEISRCTTVCCCRRFGVQEADFCFGLATFSTISQSWESSSESASACVFVRESVWSVVARPLPADSLDVVFLLLTFVPESVFDALFVEAEGTEKGFFWLDRGDWKSFLAAMEGDFLEAGFPVARQYPQPLVIVAVVASSFLSLV